MKMLLGKKVGMTRIFDQSGKAVAVSLIEVGPCYVTQIKNQEKDGYNAIQIGFGHEKHLTKPLTNHLKKANLENAKHFAEFKVDEAELENYKPGQEINIDIFNIGDEVEITGTSKGKGYAGVMKRHGFSGMPASHGHEKQRIPGSIGCRYPQRVVKGKRMAGHMGVDQINIKNLNIVDIDKENKLIAVTGAIPGPRKSLVQVITK